MSDIMREIDDAMRQERMEKFWKENGTTLIVFVIATIFLTGAISAYRAWDSNVKAEQTGELMALMEDATFPDNIKDNKLDLRPSLRGIALVNGGQKYLDAGKTEDALSLYTKAAEDKAIPEDVRHLAVLMQARLSPDTHNKLIADVARDDNSPWQYHAKLEAAALSAGKDDFKTARVFLAEIMDTPNLPDTLYDKARALDHIYALKAPQATESAPSKTGS